MPIKKGLCNLHLVAHAKLMAIDFNKGNLQFVLNPKRGRGAESACPEEKLHFW